MNKFKLDWLILPLIGVVIMLALWHGLAGKKIYVLTTGIDEVGALVSALPEGDAKLKAVRPQLVSGNVEALKARPDVWEAVKDSFEEKRVGLIPDLPNVVETWVSSKPYIVDPWTKRGEMDQGILRFTWYSLVLVAQGYAIALIIGVPLGFCLGLSKTFTKMFDPLIQVLRPVSPLAWLPLGLVLFMRAGPEAGTYAALFTIALCGMWPTVLNTAVGVRAVPQDYLNVGRVLKLSRWKMLTKILIPATLPYMFTGFRLSLGIAWLAIVAAEMLTGRPGAGGFLWQEYNALIYEHIIFSILTIGIVGLILDRLMSLVEARFKAIS
ncbi:MAG: nitrate ABC transporter permease [Rariglobus sp.]|nr:nitrate ABC transporter permease [Rariglobus sp.]